MKKYLTILMLLLCVQMNAATVTVQNLSSAVCETEGWILQPGIVTEFQHYGALVLVRTNKTDTVDITGPCKVLVGFDSVEVIPDETRRIFWLGVGLGFSIFGFLWGARLVRKFVGAGVPASCD